MEKSMTFHRVYTVILYIRGVLSAITCLGLLMSNVFLALLGIGECILTFVTAYKLSSMHEGGLTCNIGLHVIFVLAASGSAAISAGGLGFFFGLLFSLAISIPILVYYNKRADMFGEPVSIADKLRRNMNKREQENRALIDENKRKEQIQDEIGFAARTNQYNSEQSKQKSLDMVDWCCEKCGERNSKYDNICCKCGEKKVEAKPNSTESHSVEEEVVEAILGNIAEGVLGTAKNTENERASEGSSSFGLIPQQPIYTRGIDEQERYLARLYTDDGEKVLWERTGSTSVSGVYGMIDIYDTRRQSGEHYKTIYINMYGSETSSRAPIGFSFSKSYQSGVLTHRHNPARAKGCETNQLTDVDNLANSSILAVYEHVRKTSAKKILAYSTLTLCDTALFTCFLVRALCIGSSTNRRAAIDFSNAYVKRISVGIKEKFLPDADYYEEMFANRMEFYDRVFMNQSGIENKISAITEEFGYILNMDKAKGEYVAYSEESPLVLLGIDEMYEREAEIKEYVNRIPEYLSPFYERVIDSLRS